MTTICSLFNTCCPRCQTSKNIKKFPILKNLPNLEVDKLQFLGIHYPEQHIKVFKKSIEPYQYVQDFKAMLSNGFDIVRQKNGIKFKNFNIVNEEYKGVCHQQAASLIKDLKKHPLSKEYNFIMAQGNDNQYFTNEGSDHFFVAAIPKKINKINKSEILIIDPSFKKIGKIKNLKYKIKELLDETSTQANIIFENNCKRALPLGFANSLGIGLGKYNPIIYMKIANKEIGFMTQLPNQRLRVCSQNVMEQIIKTKDKDFQSFLLKIKNSCVFKNFSNSDFKKAEELSEKSQTHGFWSKIKQFFSQ